MWNQQRGRLDAPKELTSEDIALAVSEVLFAVAGEYKSTAKRIAREIGADPRTVEHWLSAAKPPTLKHAILLMRAFPEFADTIDQLANRTPPLTEKDRLKLERIRQILSE